MKAMKSNNNNHSTTRLFDHLTRSAHGMFPVLIAFTAVFVFLSVMALESFGSDVKNKYHGFYVVSSHKNFDDAEALVDRLKAQGYYPFRKTINIPNKGDWHRVYVNHYGSKKEAVSAGKKLREKGILKGFFILDVKKKYHGFYVVSSYKNFDNAEALVDRLKAQGYDPFCITVDIPNTGKYRRVYVKRYENKKEALLGGKKLREKGVFKTFFILFVKPEDKKVALSRNSDKEDNKNTSPPVLTKIEATVVLPVPALAKGKADPAKTLTKIEIPVVPSSTKEKIHPLNTEEITPPHKMYTFPISSKDNPDTGLKMGKKSYDSAMSDFTAGRYETALGKFKKIIKIEKNEAVMRRIADCYYFLGKKGDKGKRSLLEAIDQYSNIIRNYPGLKKENALATFRLAQSSSRLKLYSNALMEFKNLCSRYPESDYFSQSLYMMGKMKHKTGNLNGAVMIFKKYIKRFPDGQNVKEAYFSLGDCYSQMHQFKEADVWYGNALKRWPAVEDIPEDTFLNLGSHYFQTGKYSEALEVFFVYLNLFPNGKNCSNALYKIASSFEEMDELPLALKVLSQVVERYPGSGEALKSSLMMANIGVKDPEIKFPVNIFSGMDYYRNPIEAYDKMGKQLSDPDSREGLVFQEELVFRKGCALIKRKRYKEAFDNFRFLLDNFFYGTYKKEGEENFILSAGGLIDDYYSKKDYLAVSDVYYDSDRNVLLGNGNFDMLFKIGISLKKIGLSDQATELFDEMIKVFNEDKKINELSLAIANMDYDKSFYKGARKRLEQLLGKSSDLDKKTAMTARELLGDVCYKEGLFKEAVGFYLGVMGNKERVEDSATIRKKYADSLRGMDQYSSAHINYKRVLKNCGDSATKCSDSVIMGSYEGLGDCLYSEGKYQQAIMMYEKSLKGTPEGNQSMWAVFNIGRGYAILGNKPMADKSFNSLKRESSNEFWPRVMDYYTTHKNWTTGLEI